jgi:hypothetical protein
MRRHAEGLIILSGSTPGRGWREPVPIVDVLRAAVAEVEDYVRVDVLSESRDLVAGNAVNDVIHLVAELVENATVFSPPNTRIDVRADRAGVGLVAEVEDRGLGLSQEELADINLRLANPPEFDPANSEQLGLFVVSRLAARHSIKVSLRESVYGGTTAILLLPFGVIVREEEAGPFAGEGSGPGVAQEPAGQEPADTVLPPAEGRSAPPWLPLFGSPGRHRLAAAATGRRADTDVTPWGQNGETQAPRPLPRPPWEYEQAAPGQHPEAPAPAAPAGKPPWDAESGPSWFDPFSRTPVRREPGRPSGDPPFPAPTEPPAQQAVAEVASSGSHLGMPIRVPQASLAPQLRAPGGGAQGGGAQGGGAQGGGSQGGGSQQAGGAEPDVDARSPEATRTMLISMQQGWERGRVDDLEDPAGVSDNETER